MSTVTAEFTIREATLCTGSVQIDTDRWLEVIGEPYSAETADIDAVAVYVGKTSANVEERDWDIQGQEWSDLELKEQSA